MLKRTSRIISADVIRVVAMLMVIYIHTIYSFTMRLDFFATKSWFIFEPLTALSKTSMVLFFTLSGYLVICKKRTIKENWVNIRKRILVPLIAFTFIYALLQVVILKLPVLTGLKQELLAAVPHFPTNWLWFLVVLFFLYLFNPLWQNLFSHDDNSKLAKYLVGTLMLFTVVTITIKFLTSDTYFFNSFTSWLGYLGFFLYGGLVRNKWLNINHFKLNLTLIVLGLGLVIAGDYYTLFTQIHSQQLLLAGYFNDYLSIPVLLCALGIFNLVMSNYGVSIIKKYINGTKLKIFQGLAMLSFGIYLIHPIVVGVLSDMLGVSIDNMHVNLYLYNLAYFGVVLLASTFVVYIILKIPKLNLILGAK
jgi:surface polysaccharide O-acyltransferase-like enzyme